MSEEVSPESKLYVKEEIEKMRKEFKEDLKDAQSKATKTFATIAMIVGLLGSLGIYGLVKNALNNTTIKSLESDAIEKRNKIITYEQETSEILSKLRASEQDPKNGYACFGDVQFVWGSGDSTGQDQVFEFNHAFEENCVAVFFDRVAQAYPITDTDKKVSKFKFHRHADYTKDWGTTPIRFNYVAIGSKFKR